LALQAFVRQAFESLQDQHFEHEMRQVGLRPALLLRTLTSMRSRMGRNISQSIIALSLSSGSPVLLKLA